MRRHGRACCLARGHDRHLFGDITDTLLLGQVDICDLVGGEEDAVLAVRRERSDGDALATEGLRDLPVPSFEADVVLGCGDRADDLALVIFHLRQAVRHRARARSIAAGRHLLVEGLMWPIAIVDRPPSLEGTLHLGEIAEAPQGKDFSLERAVEALVLATALRMIGPAVQNTDAKLEQPNAKPGPALPRRIAPRSAVVDKKGLREPVTAERQLQSTLHGAAPLVGAGFKTQVIARMIVKHGQRMTAASIAQRHPALEVHLPEQVRRRLLKSLQRRRSSGRRDDATIPAQDLVHRRHRRRFQSPAFQATGDLARAPGRMGVAHCKNLCLSRPSPPRRACVGTPRAIGELPIGFPAAQPLVTGVRVDPEPPAQLAPVHPLLHCQPNKLTPLIHDRHLAPRHGWPPCSRIHAMMMCRPCPRTPVGDVSGLYNCPGHPRLAYAAKTWMPGTRPGMTTGEARLLRHEGLE